MHTLVDNTIRLSVRDLVEFILRSGNLDNRRSTVADRDAMREGAKIHRKIQSKQGMNYRPEVSLKITVPVQEINIQLEGRADGVLTEPTGVTIDEIKGVYMDVAKLEVPILVHKAQAVCYGYIYALQNQLEDITIQLTYCNIETEEIKKFQDLYSFTRIEEEFNSYIREYGKWAMFLFQHRRERNASISSLQFPFPYRKGQRDLVVSVYRTITKEKTLFIQAPTGIGKTLSTTFPAVKAIGEGYGEKIFYLTAKTITRSVAMESFDRMRKDGLRMSSMTITAKEKMCPLSEMECNPLHCTYAKGHFDRVNAAVYDIITHEWDITRELITSYAEKHNVCPFEMSLDISYWVDTIVCDYNYTFDPNVKLQRYFGEGTFGGYIFLVDEAHNLVDRAREMFSAVIYKESFLSAKKIYQGYDYLVKRINKCNQILLQLKRECTGVRVLEEGEGIGSLVVALNSLYSELQKFAERHPEFQPSKEASEFFFSIRDFLNIYDRLDENYKVYTEFQEDGKFMVKLLCVNPSVNLKECLQKGRATIFFSATLLPIRYYKALLSGNQEDYAIYAHSPFDSSNRLLCIGQDVSSRYTRRNKIEYKKIATYISNTVEVQRGNYLVFCPSYSYMKHIEIMLKEVNQPFHIITQEANMNEWERESFLEQFSTENRESLVGLCVMGGIFSEGIDLRQDRLIGVIIIGTGLPQICTEREILKDFYNEQGENGFDFAYRYPGMNKVMQSAGRLIRTDKDQGVVLLLDDRFLQREYLEQFPMEWGDYLTVRGNTAPQIVKDFWSRIKS